MWYMWLLIGLGAGTTAGFFLACLLYCSKEAEQSEVLRMRLAQLRTRNFELREHRENYNRGEVGT